MVPNATNELIDLVGILVFAIVALVGDGFVNAPIFENVCCLNGAAGRRATFSDRPLAVRGGNPPAKGDAPIKAPQAIGKDRSRRKQKNGNERLDVRPPH